MKPLKLFLVVAIPIASSLNFIRAADAADASSRQIHNVSELRTVPEGNYLVTLELSGKQQRLNFKVQGNKAKCVNSTIPAFRDIAGQFRSNEGREGGTFIGSFRGSTFGATQVWIFRPDGSAAIREVPDRGEQQSAQPVKGDSIESQKGK